MIGSVPSFRGRPSRPLRTAAISARIDSAISRAPTGPTSRPAGPRSRASADRVDAEPAEVLGAALLGPAGAQRADVADRARQGLGEHGAGGGEAVVEHDEGVTGTEDRQLGASVLGRQADTLPPEPRRQGQEVVGERGGTDDDELGDRDRGLDERVTVPRVLDLPARAAPIEQWVRELDDGTPPTASSSVRSATGRRVATASHQAAGTWSTGCTTTRA